MSDSRAFTAIPKERQARNRKSRAKEKPTPPTIDEMFAPEYRVRALWGPQEPGPDDGPRDKFRGGRRVTE